MDELPAHADDFGVGVNRDFHIPVLIALLMRGQKILAPVFDPFHRPTQQCSGGGDVDVLRVKRALGAEAAADIGRHHADLMVTKTEHFHHAALDAMRALGRHVQRVGIVMRIVFGNDAAALHKKRPAAMLVNFFAKHMRRAGERAIGVAYLQRKARGDIRFRTRVRQRRARIQRGAAIVDRRQRFVIDFHQLRGIFGDVAAVGDHARHRFSGVTGFVLGERVRQLDQLDRRMRHQQRQRVVARGFWQISVRQHGMHAGQGERGGFVDAVDFGVRVGAAHKGGVQHFR